ncbi:MAG: DNA primase small subunit PriS [Candidatus Bathyarchaeia archaeon]
MNQKSRGFVKNLFSEYYMQAYSPKAPPTMERREFGFVLFEGFVLRHKSFRSVYELKHFLGSSAPMDVYYSCAYYENPEAEMAQKAWLGADLIFDVDADHIPTNCEKIHDEWFCGVCGFAGKGVKPEKCPICNSEKFSVTSWPCETCLESAKTETTKLLDILMDDFGFSSSEIQTFFSGHRGYHVQIESEALSTLDSAARKEIVDYITCLGLETPLQNAGEIKAKTSTSNQTGYGWSKRLNVGLIEFIRNAEENDLIKIGLKRNIAEAIMQNKESLLKHLTISGRWKSIRGVGSETVRILKKHVANLQSAKIDTVVTTDIHRLIRLSETLHGKTGLKKTWFPTNEIEVFDPFKKASAFKKGTITLFVSDSPKFKLNGETFGPYKNQKVELPTSAAILLICKNKAEVLE